MLSLLSNSSSLVRPASAALQTVSPVRKHRKVVVFHPADGRLPVRILEPKSIQSELAPHASTFVISWVGSWPADAMNAFNYAVSIWEATLISPVPIQVTAYWDTDPQLGTRVLGWSQAVDLQANFLGAPARNTWYQNALANELAGRDLRPDQADIEIGMNARFPYWYLGTDGNPSVDNADFVSVVVHELAHGLGFYGTMEVDDANGTFCNQPFFGCWGFPTQYAQGSIFPAIFDRFTVDMSSGSASNLDKFSSPSQALAVALTGGAIYFNGYSAVTANDGQMPQLYAPAPWEGGSSYSHVDEAVYSHTGNALMTPSLGPGEVTHYPGPIVCGVFTDLGWGIQCANPSTGSSHLYLPIISRGGAVITGGIPGGVTLDGAPGAG